MKLAIILLSLPFALGYEQPYKGFDNCGMDGWSCDYVNNKYQVTYTCSPWEENARVWVWTARLPSGASIFTVRNCNHLEVHMDCTRGLRTTVLRQFNVINVTFLEILPPLPPGIFLHDNEQLPQAPPVFNVENVKKMKFYPGLFSKPGGTCRYKYVELVSFSVVNSNMDRLMKDLLRNQNLDTFILKDVVIDAIDNNAIAIHADATISGTTFPYIPGNGINIRGENISFINNTFKKIETLGLSLRTKDFKFSHNHVGEINNGGLEVLGAKIEISNNVFNHLETGALQKITPAYSPVTYEIAYKLTYNFSNNVIKNINPGSLHTNWEIYKKVCSEITFKNNLFDCSCINLGWISLSNGLGPKISKVKEFYDIYVNGGENKCISHEHCPLGAVISAIQDICNNKTNVSNICSASDAFTDTSTSPEDMTVTSINSSPQSTYQQVFATYPVEVTEKAIPIYSYMENRTSHVENRGIPVWFVVIPIIVILAAISLGVFMWWYKKNKQRQIVTTMYKNEKGADADSLIVINEHHNELYGKQ